MDIWKSAINHLIQHLERKGICLFPKMLNYSSKERPELNGQCSLVKIR